MIEMSFDSFDAVVVDEATLEGANSKAGKDVIPIPTINSAFPRRVRDRRFG